MHLLFFFFFCSLQCVHPSPTTTTTTTLTPLNRHTALGVTAGITCRASGALHFANGLISCEGHPISPEIDSLSILSSLTGFCPDSRHECCDGNAQGEVYTCVTCGVLLKLCICVLVRISSCSSAVFSWCLKTARGCFFFENRFLCDLESIVSIHEKFRCSHGKYGNSAESWIRTEMLHLYFTFCFHYNPSLKIVFFCCWWNVTVGTLASNRT